MKHSKHGSVIPPTLHMEITREKGAYWGQIAGKMSSYGLETGGDYGQEEVCVSVYVCVFAGGTDSSVSV